jgi:hypothetical protein
MFSADPVTGSEIQGYGSMEYSHRIIIGMMGELGKEFSEGSQKLANKMALGIGKQIGDELLERKLINDKMEPVTIVNILLKELEFAGTVKEITTPSGKVIEIENCNICPKKIGKYPLKETACPMPGIIKGTLNSVNLFFNNPFPDLEPGQKCRITIK